MPLEEHRRLDKFFKNYPKYHIFKFFWDRDLSRLIQIVILKIIYWIWFKPINRIKVVNKERIFKMPFIYKVSEIYNEDRKSSDSNTFYNLVKKENRSSLKLEANINFNKEPCMFIINHVGNADVIMVSSILAHFGINSYTFISEAGFNKTESFFLIALQHFAEEIPRFGNGQQNIDRIVKRLICGDKILLFPAGTYPGGKFSNTGFVQEPYTGAARVSYEYFKRTGKPLKIIPICSLGANLAYPPKKYLRPKEILSIQIFLKIGNPYALFWDKELNYSLLNTIAFVMQKSISMLWGQKRLIPNVMKNWMRKRAGGAGKPRIYK